MVYLTAVFSSLVGIQLSRVGPALLPVPPAPGLPGSLQGVPKGPCPCVCSEPLVPRSSSCSERERLYVSRCALPHGARGSERPDAAGRDGPARLFLAAGHPSVPGVRQPRTAVLPGGPAVGGHGAAPARRLRGGAERQGHVPAAVLWPEPVLGPGPHRSAFLSSRLVWLPFSGVHRESSHEAEYRSALRGERGIGSAPGKPRSL